MRSGMEFLEGRPLLRDICDGFGFIKGKFVTSLFPGLTSDIRPNFFKKK